MTDLASWTAFVLLAPVLGFLPGYLVLRALPTTTTGASLDAETGYETVGLSVAVSFAILVLVAFALSQTVGISRASLLVTHLALLVGLALAGSGTPAEEPDEDAEEPPPSSTSPQPDAGAGTWLPSRRLSATILGVVVLFLAIGAGLFDGSQPYSEAYYANASEVSVEQKVAPGERVNWTLVVENHEEQPTAYRIETRLIAAGATNTTRNPGEIVDVAELRLEDGARAEHEIAFAAPDCCAWKVKTFVEGDAPSQPLTVHRWLQVTT